MNENLRTRGQGAKRKLNFTYEEPRNPLLNILIFGELIEYLNAPGKNSYSTLKHVRLVCHLWNDLISRRFQSRSIITTNPKKKLAQLNKTFETSSQESEQIRITSVRISNAEWFEMYHIFHWIPVYGQKLIGLELEGLQLTVKNLVNLLKGCPNLEEVTLKDLTMKTESHYCIELVHNTRQFHFKHLTIKRGNPSGLSGSEHPEDVEELAKHVLIGLPPLESLNLHLTPGSCNLITLLSTNPLTMNTVSILNNLKRLDLWNVYKNAAAEILNACGVHFRSLKELEIGTTVLANLKPFLKSISKTLEKLVWNGILCTHTNTSVIQLPNLKEYAIRYIDISDNGPPSISIDGFMSSLPALKSWSAGVFKCDCRIQLSRINCEYANCNHVDLILTPGDINFRKNDLEKLQLFCSLRSVNALSHLVNFFPNLKELSLWIHSASLKKYFAILKNLQQLELLTIDLSQSITDISFAINFYLPNLKNLKELTFAKASRRIFADDDWHPVFLLSVNKSHSGIVRCKRLKILSFKTLTIDPHELEDLRMKLLKKKPKLAFNAYDYM